MQATVWRGARWREPTTRPLFAARPLLVIAIVTAAVWGVVVVADRAPAAIGGRDSSVWMSGEARGRVVLSSPGGERSSLGVELSGAPSTYDVATIVTTVLVHDRQTGDLTSIDARNGEVRGTAPGPTPVDDRSVLVDAGDSAYLVDVASGSASRLDTDGVPGAPFEITGGFTGWAGTADGVLWLVDDATGAIIRFDGERAERDILAAPGTALEVTAAGDEPAVLDRASMRLRWPRRSTAVDLAAAVPDAAGADLALEGPDHEGRCVTVLSASWLACVGPEGIVRSRPVSDVGSPATAQVFADDHVAVVARPGDASVSMLGWDGSDTTVERSAPTGRRLAGGRAGVGLMIDDPGSTHAFSVVSGRFVTLDKFSKRTVVINAQISSDDGLGSDQPDAAVSGPLPTADSGTASDDARNDPPSARPDRAVTRAGRSVTIPVLANDTDPDGDPLAVRAAGPVSAADGTVTVVGGSRVSFDPPPESTDRSITFPYTVADTGNLDDTSTVTVEIVGSGRNTAPSAEDDTAATQTNRSVDIEVTANDTDAEGDPLSVTGVGTAAHGAVAVSSQGVVRYEPDTGFEGTDSFTYDVVDGYGGDASARVEVRVEAATGPNRPPVANDDRASARAGTALTIDPLLNDTDPDGDTLRVVGVGSVSGLSIGVENQRVLRVTPADTVAGLLSVRYTVADGEGLQATATIALFVQGGAATSEPPVATDDQAAAAGVAIPIDVVANDIDPGGGQLVVDSWTQPTPGSGSTQRLSPTTILFTPTIGFRGSTRFEYTVKNVAGQIDTASVTVEVTGGSGSGPVARNDTATVFPGEVASIDALANDSHPDGLPFTYVGQPVVRAGRATIEPDRTISFAPPDATLSSYLLTYTIQDVNGRRSRADITVTVVPRPLVNSAPIASNDLETTRSDVPVVIDVLANDTDPDSDPLTIVAVGAPTIGSASVIGSAVRYVPPPRADGLASMTYTVRDAGGLTATATIVVLITPPATFAPIANPDLVVLVVGTTTTIDVTENDLDPDGHVADLDVTALGEPFPSGPSAQRVPRGVRVNAGGVVGTFTIGYTITDGDGLSSTGTITVVVEEPPNAPPVANPDVYALSGGVLLNVLDNDSDPDGGELTIAAVSALSPPTAGSIAQSGNRVAITPAPGYSGPATFTYTIRDAQGASSTASVSLSITACPAAPVLDPIEATTRFQTPVTIALFGGSPAPEGWTVALGVPASGAATLSGSGSVRYMPGDTTNGTVLIPWQVTTTCGDSATSSIRVIVNQPPLAGSDRVSTASGQPVVVAVLANDSDPDGDVLVVTDVFDAVGGSVSLTGGKVTFAPGAGESAGSFRYRIADPAGSTSTATVTVTIDRPPVAVTRALTMDLTDSPLIIDGLDPAAVSDPDGDALRVVGGSATSSAGATAQTIGNDAIRFVPRASGTFTVTYRVQEQTTAALTTDVTVRITVTDQTATTPATTSPPTTTPATDPPTTTAPATTAPTTTAPATTAEPTTTTEPTTPPAPPAP